MNHTTPRPTLAVLGIGMMGYPMARRLCEAGFTVHAWNRSRAKAERLLPFGAQVHDTPAQAVAAADLVITLLEDGRAVEDVLFQQGTTEGLRPGSLVVDMSSIQPRQARDHAARLAAIGVQHLDAPVSGGTVGAEAGTLAIMAGGEAGVIEGLSDFFAPLGRVTHVGPSGAGQICKLANQQIVAITIGAVAEAMMLVEAGGASREKFREAIRGGFAESRILELHGQRMVDRRFEPGGLSRLQLKDLNAVAAMAETYGLDLPLTSDVHKAFEAFVAAGNGNLDHSALLLHLEKINDRRGLAHD